MKKLLALVCLVVATATSGCAHFGGTFGHTTVGEHMIQPGKTSPSEGSSTHFTQGGKGFTNKGAIEAEGSAFGILGIFGGGDTGYKLLLDKAKAAGGDSASDVVCDVKEVNFLGFYYKIETHWWAQAVAFNK